MNGNQIDKLWACLCNVMDPEVGINVVEKWLGKFEQGGKWKDLLI